MLLNKSCERTLTSFMVVVATWTLVSWCFVCFSTFTMRCALGCERNVGTPLHRFPNPDKFPEQFKAWVNVMGEKLTSPEDYLQYKHKRICDIHFKTQHRNRNNRLSALAVPSLHLPMWCNESDVTSPSTSSVGLSRAETNVEQDKIAEPCIETLPVSLTAANDIRDEHNYCSEPSRPIQKDEIAVPSAEIMPVSFTAANLIREEHNYHSKPSTAKRNGKRTIIPSHPTNKLKTCIRQVKNLKREILRLRKRGLSFKARLENAQKTSDNVAFQKITKNMTNPAKMFTMMQFREGSKKPKGRRYTTEEKILSLSLFKKCSKQYSVLAREFALPSRKSLKLLLSTVQLTPGINTIVFEKIKKTVHAMNDDKKLCTIIFDEMSITPQIHYDAARDQLKGFTCNGQKIADHVLVFMVKGIKANFKQPVAYYFTNSLNKIELKATLIDVIKNVQATGLRVMCTVCDQCTVNVSVINSLVEDTKSQYMREGREFRFTHFKVDKEIIIPLYDVPHLLKGIRNNLLSKDLIYYDESNNKKIIKWEYFEMLYAADKTYGELRVAHKLTEEHINKEKIKKMKVKTAAQVFSHSVAVATEHLSARGDLPPECRDLIPFVLLLDQLFDSLNGNTFHIPNGKIYKGSVKRNSPHHLLWQKSIKLLKTVKFIIRKNSGGKVRFIESTVPSIVNFIKTIEGVQSLWKILNEKYSFDTLLTRYLNQDPVENFFGNIRSYGVRNVAPNCVAFEGAYKSLLLNNFNTPHSIQANCEEDQNDCLQTLDFFLTEKSTSPTIPDQRQRDFIFNEEILNTTEEVEKDKGQRNYVCGWVLTKCYKNITKSCKTCKKELSSDVNDESNSLIKAKEYNRKKKWLCYPSKGTEKIFQEIQKLTCQFLKKDVPKYGLKSNIKMMCDLLIDINFTCNVHKEKLKAYFVDVTIKILLYSWCRSINRILSGKITFECEDDDELKLAAHVYYTKHKHNKTPK